MARLERPPTAADAPAAPTNATPSASASNHGQGEARADRTPDADVVKGSSADASVGGQRVDHAQAGEATEAMVVRGENEPVLDCKLADPMSDTSSLRRPESSRSSAAIVACPAPAATSRTAGCSKYPAGHPSVPHSDRVRAKHSAARDHRTNA